MNRELNASPTIRVSRSRRPLRLWRIVLAAIVGVIILFGFYRVMEEIFLPAYDATSMPLHQKIIGDGPRKIVLIHGYLGSLRYWDKRLSGLERDHQVLMVDLLGFGRSPKPDADYSLRTHVEAVRQVARQHGFLSPGTTILGHSLGAVITLALLAEEPDPTIRGALLALPTYKSPEEAERSLSRISPLFRAMINNSLSMHFICKFMDVFRIPIFARAFNVPTDVYLDSLSHTWTSASRTLQNAIIDTDVNKLANQAAANHPLLFLHSDGDQVAPYRNARALAASLPSARFETLKTSDHQGFLTEPDEVWKAVRDFEGASAPAN